MSKKHSHEENLDVVFAVHVEEYYFIDGEHHHHHHHHHKHHGTRLVLQSLDYQSLQIKNSIIMAVTISTLELVNGTLGLVDHATQSPITNVTFSNVSFTSSDETIFTAAPNTLDPTMVVVTGVAVGTATLSITADVAYTDLSGNSQTETGKTATVSVTVTQGTTQATTDLVVNFGTPQAK